MALCAQQGQRGQREKDAREEDESNNSEPILVLFRNQTSLGDCARTQQGLDRVSLIWIPNPKVHRLAATLCKDTEVLIHSEKVFLTFGSSQRVKPKKACFGTRKGISLLACLFFLIWSLERRVCGRNLLSETSVRLSTEFDPQ